MNISSTGKTLRRLSLSLLPLASLLLVASLSNTGCNALLDSRHPLGLCGDGVLQTEQGEQCDDGNTVGGDKCSATCQIEACGNEIPDQGEECDRGVGNDNSGDCTLLCKKARCGDGYQKTRGTAPYEVCDDGNSINGDGCNPQCTLRGRLTIIGGTPGGKGLADGVGQAARFAEVRGMVSDGTYIYMRDKWACTVRRMRVATGEVETIAGSPGNCKYATNDGLGKNATFSRNPSRLALVGDKVSKHLYLDDGNSLRQVDLGDSDYPVKTCADFPEKVMGITGLAGDSTDSSVLYVSGHAGLFSVSLPCTCNLQATSNPCTFQLRAGSMNEIGSIDGKGTAARFKLIKGLTVDPKAGVLYVADMNRVRQVDPKTWEVKTVAGDAVAGHLDGVGTAARFYALQDLALHTSAAGQRLYAVDQSIELAGASSTDGKLGWGNVRRIDLSTFQVRTVAGTYGAVAADKSPETDGFGPLARLLDPWSLALAGDVLYIGEGASVRGLNLESGQVATAAGVLVQDFGFYDVWAVAAGAGVAYVVARTGDLMAIPLTASKPVRKVGMCAPSVHSAAHWVRGMVLEGDLLYVADLAIEGICRIDLSGKLGQDKGCDGFKESCEVVYQYSKFLDLNTAGLAKDGDSFYVTDRKVGRILRLGSKTQPPQQVATGTTTRYPWGVVVIGGVLYTAITEENQVLRIDPQSGATRALGSGLARTANGKGATASFCRPTALATDGTYLYVGESHCEPDSATGTFHGHAIRQVDLKTEQVNTLVGPGPRPYVVEGAGVWASVNWPAAMTYDATTKALYVADMWDNVLLKVD